MFIDIQTMQLRSIYFRIRLAILHDLQPLASKIRLFFCMFRSNLHKMWQIDRMALALKKMHLTPSFEKTGFGQWWSSLFFFYRVWHTKKITQNHRANISQNSSECIRICIKKRQNASRFSKYLKWHIKYLTNIKMRQNIAKIRKDLLKRQNISKNW